MSFKIVLVLLHFYFTCAFAQVCQNSILRVREEPRTFQYTYYEAYEDTSCLFWCTKSRLATNIGVHIVTQYYTEVTDECCDGYVQDETNRLNCLPKCGNNQCQNGFCNPLNECICNPGYVLDPDDNTKCLPIMDNNVECPIVIKNCNGSIIQVKTSNETYLNVTENICSENIKDVCCSKTDSYNDSNKDGSSNEDSENEERFPYDEEGSKNNDRFNFNAYDDENSCGECDNGQCVGAICVCNPGWYLNDNETCLPHCEVCINGICKEPNKCECLDGYHFEVNATQQCVPNCNCEEGCVIPNVCNEKSHVSCEKCKETCTNATNIKDEIKTDDGDGAHLVRIKVFHDQKHKISENDHNDPNVMESFKNKEVNISEIHI